MAAPLKILLLGPSRSHKSPLANFLCGLCDNLRGSAVIGSTVGVRVLESDKAGVSFELWDVAGDQSYEATWPAVAAGADGVMLVYNPATAGAAKEVELWNEWFVAKNDIPSDRVVCYALSEGVPAGGVLPSLGPVPVEQLSIESEDAVRKSFDRFLGKVSRSARR